MTVTRNEIIEMIAQRWYETSPRTQTTATWDTQPESVKRVFRTLAAQFWRKPSALTQVLQAVAFRYRQSESDIERATKAWL